MLPHDTILHSDALATLRTLPPESVHCIVTSPPYWGLRDYGAPGQLGLEPTPEEYVARMVEALREARRVLRSDGTLWLNLGDSYASGGGGDPQHLQQWAEKVGDPRKGGKKVSAGHDVKRAPRSTGLKPKDLVGIPWRVAFALQADGWWLRSDIIWHKPNCMPESVRDRPTKAHEYVFLLTKAERYYYDADAVREPIADIRPSGPRAFRGQAAIRARGKNAATGACDYHTGGRNRRSVWSVATAPYAGAHFAVMPPALVEPCVLAGCPGRVCETCGAPWVRVTSRESRANPRGSKPSDHRANVSNYPQRSGITSISTTLGWKPTCRCATNTGAARGVVLDPFMGAGTVGVVARRHSRHYLGIELNADYIALAETRIEKERQPVLWTIGEVSA